MSKLVELATDKKIVFVGDLHGDFETLKKITARFPLKNHRMVFLGDYVDRGEKSEETLEFVLKFKAENPLDVVLLMGNHETYSLREYYPADFWETLGDAEVEKYSGKVLNLPLAVSAGGILAIHGALPDIRSLMEIEDIAYDYTDERFEHILWGDFGEKQNMVFHARKMFGREYFNAVMARLGKNLLIRGHDPAAPVMLFDKRCVTLVSSAVYDKVPLAAVADFSKEINNADDLAVIEIR
jgi:protein phosphatase